MSTSLANIETLADDRRRTTSSAVIDWTGNGFRAINGALQIWNQSHNWLWQTEVYNFNYNEGITVYPLSSSLDFKAPIDVKPFRPAEKFRELYFLSNNKFDADMIHQYKFGIDVNTQLQYLRLKYAGDYTTINQANTLADNGTWVGATAISNVATNSYQFLNQSSSVGFDYSGTSGTLTNSTMTAQDLTRYAKRSVIYFNVYLQSVTSLTSITLLVGSSAVNYITGTATTDYLGNDFVVGWNTVKLEWSGTTTMVGTVDTTLINYIQVQIDYSVNPVSLGNSIENFFISENVPMQLEYYSNNMAMTTAGVKTQVFASAAATTDLAMWSGTWDFVNEAFINSVMEIIAWLNGDTQDRAIAVERINAYLEPLKTRLPSRRRYAEASLVADVNLATNRSWFRGTSWWRNT
jgi:hypothetical protein